MLGSTFIAESDRSKLGGIESPDDLDAFAHVALDRMTTIDVAEVLTAAGVEWTDGEPVHFSEAEGDALFKVSEAGLKYALEHVAAFPEESQSDLRKLAVFVKTHGASSIYEYATF